MRTQQTPGEPLADLERSYSHWYWMPVMVAALGITSILTLIGTNLIRERLVAQDLALIHAVGEIETGVSISHLWMEEYVTGDDVVEAEIWDNLREAGVLVEGMLEGGTGSEHRFQFRPLDEPELRLQAEGLLTLIGEDVRLETGLQSDLWNVSADPSQIEQVIVNLVINAPEAMPTGGRVMIETSNTRLEETSFEGPLVAKPGDYVVLSVSDTGHGVAPEIRDKVFEPFFTTKQKSGSSGLGLATVYAIIEQNRGHIGLRSLTGLGTTVRISLPRTLEKADSISESEIAAPGRQSGSESILLVEDNDEYRESTCSVLEELGYRMAISATAEQALKLFERPGARFDLLIADVVLPGISGPELVDRLQTRCPPGVIFISGYTDDVILRHGVEEGEVDFLQKPFTLEDLTAKVREVLDREASVRARA